MKRSIFRSMLLIAFAAVLITAAAIVALLYNDFSDSRKQELENEAYYISEALDSSGWEKLSEIGQHSSNRITLIAPDGTVLFDNTAEASELENHRDRPEVADAVEKGSGESVRVSQSLGEKTYYYALMREDGNILRVSLNTKNLAGTLLDTLPVILLAIVAALALAAVSAQFMTKKIVAPINAIDPDAPLAGGAYDELSPLLLRMDRQNRRLSDQLEEMAAKRREFETITENMSEALIIFGKNRRVLSANKSACLLFGVDAPEGFVYPALCRDSGYIAAAEQAFSEERHTEALLERKGRIYRLSFNPVKREKEAAMVLFGIDITEREQNERMRREFSANVSHELKTPLTSIMGCAELMQNGIAAPGDFPRFTEQIYHESKRLLTLIEDIIRLSSLDEGALRAEFAPVDLYAVCRSVSERLHPFAESHQVSIQTEGEECIVSGSAETLSEMVYNLCDNAIKYNRPGGRVFLRAEKSGDSAVLTVSDNGIGIASEHQGRIFERFYRVDKSRSKQTGGTGLGLSIVKHGAALHSAQIQMESEPDKGTTVRIIFPPGVG